MGHLDPTQNSEAASEKKLKAYACELEQKLEARTRELAESLEQQTATSEVLRVISSSPGELELVFQAMLANATRLCEAKFGTLFLCEGDGFRVASMHNAPPAYAEARTRMPIVRAYRDTPLWRAANTKRTAQIADITKEQGYLERDLERDPSVGAELGGYRTVLSVPMLKEGKLIGAFGIYRQEVRPFTDKQIQLVEISPTKPSPRSRTPACSTSCENRCSNRPPPPTCSRSSAAQLSISRRCSIRLSSQQPGCARRTR
jgi:hypothetical protein